MELHRVGRWGVLAQIGIIGGAIDGRYAVGVGRQTLRGQGSLQDVLIAGRWVPLLAIFHLHLGSSVVLLLLVGFGGRVGGGDGISVRWHVGAGRRLAVDQARCFR